MLDRHIQGKIEDFRQLGIPFFYPRECPVHQMSGMVSTIIGARRAGKSYRTYQVAAELVKSGLVPSMRHVCPVDFDDPHMMDLSASELSVIQRTFLKMNPGFDLGTPLLFIFDEIHKIAGWEQYAVDLARNRHWRVLVTGSSSRMLRDRVASELRGKSISSIVYPLSFREFLLFKHFKKTVESTTGQAEVARFFDEYLQWGAYPAVCISDERVKEPLLREYYDVMILRDLIQRYEVSQPRACSAVVNHLLAHIAKPFTVTSCLEYVKNAGFHVARDTIDTWIAGAEDSWLLFGVSLFSMSAKEQQRNYRKAYCIDWALANCNSPVWDGGESRALENMVFLHLKRRYARVHYYLTKSKRQEIDFVGVDNRGNIARLVQVCLDPSDPSTLRREIEPLEAAGRFFGCKEGVVVTRSDEKLIKGNGFLIHCIPAWRWMMEE
jgi:uncharacterized protein